MKSLIILALLTVSITANAQTKAKQVVTTATKVTVHQCQGITKKGEQCKRRISKGTYCYQHTK
jgi:hypothetical protein